ncbi:biotin transporter BioY [Edaphobacter sp. 12200R-103]|jgi:biotin transport system substrate-specific component|uniref:biotin transporter BioY n=1 Tax=Edaphobacter sp. 12200R-103 TaxID=2703788 RepID=UPI00138C0A41|nr:biotin transporter BioY [Edaphobacter sp. 12200R-103]QHS51095.1 biotin transporter BioY [Edaphobacter sp. 12200R-103]
MQNTLSTSPTLARPARLLATSLSGRAAVVVGATLFVAACAHISIPLPFTPVPLTLQNFAVLLVGLLLGPTAGFAAMALYLAEGAMGLPVFNPGGAGGVLQLLGPTGGYLLSYPLVAAMAGWVFRSVPLKSLYGRAALAGTLATIILFAAGSLWMAQLLHLSSSAVWTMTITPFLPGEIVKIAAAAGLAASIRNWRRA